jgi:RNA polymerase sigma-70 factor (ECF subfamily)
LEGGGLGAGGVVVAGVLAGGEGAGVPRSLGARLNRSVGVAELTGPQAGLDLIDELEGLDRYALWHAARAVLLDRLNRAEEAAEARARARALALALEANHALKDQIRRG